MADKSFKIVLTHDTRVNYGSKDGVKVHKTGDVLESSQLPDGVASDVLGSGRAEKYDGPAKHGENVNKKK